MSTPAPVVLFLKARDTVTEPRGALVKEHERLVAVLRSPSHADDKVEAEKQADELAEYKSGEEDKDDKRKKRRPPAAQS